jgi:protein-S-isoprenylcysteine O-methyltransferase Ste14
MPISVAASEPLIAGPSGSPLASQSGGKGYSWWVKARGTVGFAILIPFGCVAFFMSPWASPGTVGAMAWECGGWLLLLAGIVFRFWATLYIGGHKGQCVIAQGPYSLCRNPLYFGNFLIALSIGVFAQSLLFTSGVLIAAALYLWSTVRAEERDLGERFGQEYADYSRRVPRFFPRFSRPQTPARIEVDIRSLRIEAYRSLRLVAIPVIVYLLPFLRSLVL